MKTWRCLNTPVEYKTLFSTSKFLFLNKKTHVVFPTQNWKLWIPILLENIVFEDMNYRYIIVNNESKFLQEEYDYHNIPHLSPDEMAHNIILLIYTFIICIVQFRIIYVYLYIWNLTTTIVLLCISGNCIV